MKKEFIRSSGKREEEPLILSDEMIALVEAINQLTRVLEMRGVK